MPLAVAEMVFASVTVELRVPVATPEAFVGPDGCVSVFPPPVAASTTVAPLTGLPAASFAVTVIVDVPLPASMEVGEAETVDCVANTPPLTPPPALISNARSPAWLAAVKLAETVVRFTPHCASSELFSPDVGSAISVKPLPGPTAGPLRLAPTTPYATSLAFAKAARFFESEVTASPRAEPICTSAPAPLVPLTSTPLHCDTIQVTLDWLPE